MTIERLRAAWKSQPFQPFRIHTADGRSVTVGHPDYLSMSSGGRTIVVNHAHDEGLEIIDLLLVTNLEVPAGGN